MKLVNDWRDWWRWHSTRLIIILGMLPTVLPDIWNELPQDFKDALPEGWLKYISIGVMILALYTRVTVQTKRRKDE